VKDGASFTLECSGVNRNGEKVEFNAEATERSEGKTRKSTISS